MQYNRTDVSREIALKDINQGHRCWPQTRVGHTCVADQITPALSHAPDPERKYTVPMVRVLLYCTQYYNCIIKLAILHKNEWMYLHKLYAYISNYLIF